MSAEISRNELPLFKLKYEEAKNDGKVSFFWKGRVVMVSYAKYVIEYLDWK